MKRATIVEIISLLFVLLFLYTAVSKVKEYSTFVEQLDKSPILHAVATPVAIGLPILEILLSVMLFIPRWRLRGLYASTALMAAFTIYIIVMMIVAEHLPCSCGGAIATLSWNQHIIFNSAFILLGLTAIWLERKIRRDGDHGSSMMKGAVS